MALTLTLAPSLTLTLTLAPSLTLTLTLTLALALTLALTLTLTLALALSLSLLDRPVELLQARDPLFQHALERCSQIGLDVCIRAACV